MMNLLLYSLARLGVAMLQALPLRVVARLSRVCGALAWWFDARHRRVALNNLNRCFAAEKSPAEIRTLAKEHFRRLGESYGCAVKTASMSDRDLRRLRGQWRRKGLPVAPGIETSAKLCPSHRSFWQL